MENFNCRRTFVATRHHLARNPIRVNAFDWIKREGEVLIYTEIMACPLRWAKENTRKAFVASPDTTFRIDVKRLQPAASYAANPH
jgi:hypothetical protein